MVNISIDVTDLGGEARPGDKVVLWKPAAAGSSSHAGRVISTAPVDVFLTNGKASVPDVEPGDMRVILQCRGVESQGPIDVVVPNGNGTVTLRSLIESQFEYSPPIVSAVQEAAANASASEEAAIRAQVRSERAADRADAKVDDAINNGAELVRNEVKQDADRAVAARQAAAQSESNANASASAAATSETNAAASETNAKQSEDNAGDYAAVATTAATEAVNAMEVASEAASTIGDSVTEAAQYATSAAQSESNAETYAQNASDAADRAGTAEQIGTWTQQVQDAADRIGTAATVEGWADSARDSASAAAQSESKSKEYSEAAFGAANATADELRGELTYIAGEASGYATDASMSAERAKASEDNAAIHEANSLSAAERAEFAAEETIQQVSGDFATRNYVDTVATGITTRVNSLPTLQQASAVAMSLAANADGGKGVSVGQATSIAYGAAAALSGESSTPPPVVVEGLPVWDASYPVYLWGDSAIDRGLSGDRLEDYLRAAIHQTVVDNSNGGTPIGDLLFRTGAAPLYGTPVGGSIPAGVAPVEVDRMGADISMTHGGEVPVTWAGVSGKITYYAGRYHESGRHVVEFTRSETGEEVPISTPTRIEPVDIFDPYATHIIVSGGNDASKGYITTAPEGDKAGHLIGSYIKLVEQAAAAPVKHVLIGGVKTRAETMPGDENHKLVTQVNNQLKQLFPHIFVDRQRWLCERGPEILGLELTPDEQIQRDAGIVPARVFTDSTHVGSEIRQAEAKELWAFALAQRGWAQLKTPVNGYHMPIMDNTITTTDLVV